MTTTFELPTKFTDAEALAKSQACMDMLQAMLVQIDPVKVSLLSPIAPRDPKNAALFAACEGLAYGTIAWAVMAAGAALDDVSARTQSSVPTWVAAQSLDVLAGLFASKN